MKTIFIDTGYLLALEIANDQHHQSAIQHWNSILPNYPNFITTSFVFDETVTFLNKRGLHDSAIRIGDFLLHSKTVKLMHVDHVYLNEGWQYFCKHKDKNYSLTDCLSFVLMKKNENQYCLCF